MSRNLDILEQYRRGNDWFLREQPLEVRDTHIPYLNELLKWSAKTGGYPIYYPFVICRALMHLMSVHPDRTQAIPQILDQAAAAIDIDNPRVFEEKDFLEIYPFKEKKGFSVVDQSEGCYPLTLYPKRVDKDRKDRIWKFKESLNAVKDKWDEIKPLLDGKKKDEWDFELQESLLKIKGLPKSQDDLRGAFL